MSKKYFERLTIANCLLNLIDDIKKDGRTKTLLIASGRNGNIKITIEKDKKHNDKK